MGTLNHAVGNKPGNTEIDVSLVYGDYYFVEALVRALGHH
jgi:unsaturated chondroitin disaccharide hydrolase